MALRVYFARTLGLSLGALAVGSILWIQQAPLFLWVVLAANALVWPLIAYRAALGSKSPVNQEKCNLILDSAFGGVWVALMHGALLPSALLISMLAMDKVAFGGWRLLFRALAAQLAAMVGAGFVTGFVFEPHVTLPVVLACIPHLVLYPMIVSSSAYELLRVTYRQKETIAQMARSDMLSGLLNRGHWEQQVNEEFADLRVEGAALVLIDIDYFKRINDIHGHVVGDQVIKRVADTLREAARDYDIVARYGGDEFVMVMPEMGVLEAQARAQELQVAIGAATRLMGLAAPLTISVGVAALDDEMATLGDWIARADIGLYQAKAQGRALVVAA